MFSGVLKNALIVSPLDDLNEVADILIQDGIVTEIARGLSHENVIELSDCVVMPGLVEMHCHLREPGFENKETIETGIESAIAGGYTAVCPMANTNPVNDNPDVLKFVKQRSNKIEVHPICAVTKGLTSSDIVDFKTLKAYGAIAFSNDGKPLEDMKLLKEALIQAAAADVLVISHAEDSKYNPLQNESEYSAVLRELEVVKETDARYHFAHISTKESVELIREAKEEGWNVTCETAPHYFTLSKDDIENNHARFKMNPPLRSQEDVQAIIDGLLDGTIDVIATDHAPHTIEEKNMSFERAPMGIVGFETAFSLAYQTFVKSGYMTLLSLVRKISSNPSIILNLENQGHIRCGFRANLTIFDPSVSWVVEAKKFKSKCKISPFEGKNLQGKVVATLANGNYYKNM